MIVPGPRVVILYEDRTAGGLHSLVSKMVRVRRREENRESIAYFHRWSTNANSKLIKECCNYDRMRFHGPHRADHVFAVIDAYEVENVVPSSPRPPTPAQREGTASFEQYCQDLNAAVCGYLRDLAFAKMTLERREQETPRFHPHVLFWERESVFLAGGDVLRATRGLDLPEDRLSAAGILRTRHPTPLIEAAWTQRFGSSYSKPINGLQLFGDLEGHRDQWPSLLERLACLKEIVDELTAL
jgi:hypothetical protein